MESAEKIIEEIRQIKAKIFELMKEYTGQPDYWATRSYFSIDSFFTPEQTQELKDMFTAIKYKQSNSQTKTLKIVKSTD